MLCLQRLTSISDLFCLLTGIITEEYEQSLAVNYYNQLHKEYAIADLSRYKVSLPFVAIFIDVLTHSQQYITWPIFNIHDILNDHLSRKDK